MAGFNHNVKHGGKVYHVQTEDSGLGNPQIVTLLFDGGNILTSKKTFYGDIADAENLADIVRELMEEQHKDVLRNLVQGVYQDEDQEPAPAVNRPDPLAQSAAPTPRPAAPAASPSLTRAAPPGPPPLPGRGRSAPARPSAQQGSDASDASATLFGEDLISERSLDEVILTYLAEDREEKK